MTKPEIDVSVLKKQVTELRQILEKLMNVI